MSALDPGRVPRIATADIQTSNCLDRGDEAGSG